MTAMRRYAAGIALLFAMACSAPPKKAAEPEDPVVSDTCCCRWTPIGAEDGRASYEEFNPMECSEKQGECMAASNCAGDQGAAL
jgi:hypothetical protein